MKITELPKRADNGMKRYLIDHSVRLPGKSKPTHIKRIAVGSTDLAIKIAEIKEASGSSLTAKRYFECSEYYEKHVGYKTKADVFRRIKKDLGQYKIDQNFAAVFAEFIHGIAKTRKINTVNNYRISLRSVLNFCAGKIIPNNPIKDFGLEKMVERDRVWTDEEKLRIYNTMQQKTSHLYWSVRFAEKNPVRGRSDLWNLKVEDLLLFGPLAPCIRFFPTKTRKRQNKPTHLIELDNDILEQLQWQIKQLPDCPYLFPRIWKSKDVWHWEKMGDPRRHWSYINEKAGVQDFHFHDLRHVATTYLLELRNEQTGQRVYDEDDLKSLGIFYSPRIVELYRNRKAERVVERVRRSTFVAPNEGFAACAS